MNMLRRAQDRFAPGRDAALAALRRAVVVASDETGVRIEGSNACHWINRVGNYHPGPVKPAPYRRWWSGKPSSSPAPVRSRRTCNGAPDPRRKAVPSVLLLIMKGGISNRKHAGTVTQDLSCRIPFIWHCDCLY